MTDYQLTCECLKGNIAAQKQLYMQYAPKMKAICMRYAINEANAEDMLQEAFIKVFTKISTFKNDGPLGAWIRRVVVNTATEIYRKEKKYLGNCEIDHHLYIISSQEDVIDALAAEELMGKIQQLPKGYRLVFNMYAIEGYSHKEIGKILKISESTSKSQYSRARAAIRLMIAQELSYGEKAV